MKVCLKKENRLKYEIIVGSEIGREEREDGVEKKREKVEKD